MSAASWFRDWRICRLKDKIDRAKWDFDITNRTISGVIPSSMTEGFYDHLVAKSDRQADQLHRLKKRLSNLERSSLNQ